MPREHSAFVADKERRMSAVRPLIRARARAPPSTTTSTPRRSSLPFVHITVQIDNKSVQAELRSSGLGYDRSDMACGIAAIKLLDSEDCCRWREDKFPLAGFILVGRKTCGGQDFVSAADLRQHQLERLEAVCLTMPVLDPKTNWLSPSILPASLVKFVSK